MPENVKAGEVRGWMTKLGVARVADEGAAGIYGRRRAELATVPVRVIPYDANDPPPDWKVGDRVRHKHVTDVQTVRSEIFRHNDRWRFINDGAAVRSCSAFEPIPPTASVTLRVTGTPEEIAMLVREAREERGIVVNAPQGHITGLTVEVLP